jgi:hypothetical protein
MSEYQYYEFRAVGRPLSKQEMGALRALSTRAQITPSSFVNTYNWGNFKGDPDVLMENYFDPHFRVELLRSFKEDRLPSEGHSEQAAPRRRTVAELLDAAEAHAAERERREAERRAAEKAKLEREKAAARAKYLETLAGREKQLWEKVGKLIQTKRPNDYDRAVNLLVDLRDLAIQNRRQGEFNLAFEQLRALHSSKPSFLRRLEKAGVRCRVSGASPTSTLFGA